MCLNTRKFFSFFLIAVRTAYMITVAHSPRCSDKIKNYTKSLEPSEWTSCSASASTTASNIFKTRIDVEIRISSSSARSSRCLLIRSTKWMSRFTLAAHRSFIVPSFPKFFSRRLSRMCQRYTKAEVLRDL